MQVKQRECLPEALLFRNIVIRDAVAAEYYRNGDDMTIFVYAKAENCLLNGCYPLNIPYKGELALELVFTGVDASFRGVPTGQHSNMPIFEDFFEGDEVLLLPSVISEGTRPLGLPWRPEDKPRPYRIYTQYGFFDDDDGYRNPPTASIYCKEQFHYVRKGMSFHGDFLWDIRAASAHAYIDFGHPEVAAC
ncbi:hypothetical protein [Microbulbifer hydrolyticus]|uniref:DUF2169 domain-containing protein n=1 Tax=Microbulbifer hydrolyticus TaxID=48074 RepID=A0A6P1T4U1_9GAMM|nr:hypothetical protein [Microbulbifer hydrolyticus]MBB5211481.1 hypothetical protein [Microbulbifer hydrolyticus]QHQ37768.1 hypothetical protein GTQ55_01375 [Microbulbifer hydrolyticus]